MTKIQTIFLLVLLTGCKFNFTDNDLISYNIYKVNDTLIFKNSRSDLDTFIISSKTIFNKGSDENTGWYNPPIGNVTFKDLPNNHYGRTIIRWGTSDTIIQDCSLITIYKDKPNGSISEVLYFKNFIGRIDRRTQKTANLDNLKYGNLLKVPSFDTVNIRDSTEITNIYWSDKFGIIAYDLRNGDKWKLKSK